MLTRLLARQHAIALLIILLLALGLKLAVALMPLPWMKPAISWSMAGMRWRDGYTLYAELYTSLDPLAVFFYGLFGSLVQHPLFHLIGSSLVIILLAFYYNYTLNRFKVFPKNNYFPALLLVVLTSIYPDQLLLSPSLLGATMVLPALAMLMGHFRQEQKEEFFFRMGLLLGIASLFFSGYWLVLLMSVLATVLFSVSVPRKIVLMLLGAFFPLILICIYYFWINNLGNWYRCNLSYYFHWPMENDFASLNLIKISIVPGILLLFSFIAIAGVRFIHFQYRILQLHIIWLLVAVLVFLLNTKFGIYNSIFFWLAYSYFVSHLFLSIQNSFIRETLFLSSVAGILILNFYVLKKGDESSAKIFLKETDVQQANVLLLSSDIRYAIGNKACGPYLDWNLFHEDFNSLDRYASLSHIYGTIHNESPDLIVDGNAYLPLLMKRIPEIEEKYTSQDGVLYFKKK
ncbi:MAG: hypothetical protein MUF42_00755 [Cytophagaceae bacterium]|nr:hypothetical protein [Cytophagaceae bacterium]